MSAAGLVHRPNWAHRLPILTPPLQHTRSGTCSPQVLVWDPCCMWYGSQSSQKEHRIGQSPTCRTDPKLRYLKTHSACPSWTAPHAAPTLETMLHTVPIPGSPGPALHTALTGAVCSTCFGLNGGDCHDPKV